MAGWPERRDDTHIVLQVGGRFRRERRLLTASIFSADDVQLALLGLFSCDANARFIVSR